MKLESVVESEETAGSVESAPVETSGYIGMVILYQPYTGSASSLLMLGAWRAYSGKRNRECGKRQPRVVAVCGEGCRNIYADERTAENCDILNVKTARECPTYRFCYRSDGA